MSLIRPNNVLKSFLKYYIKKYYAHKVLFFVYIICFPPLDIIQTFIATVYYWICWLGNIYIFYSLSNYTTLLIHYRNNRPYFTHTSYYPSIESCVSSHQFVYLTLTISDNCLNENSWYIFYARCHGILRKESNQETFADNFFKVSMIWCFNIAETRWQNYDFNLLGRIDRCYTTHNRVSYDEWQF